MLEPDSEWFPYPDSDAFNAQQLNRRTNFDQQKLSVVSYSFEFEIERARQRHGCTDRQLFNLAIVASFEGCRARQNKHEHQLVLMI